MKQRAISEVAGTMVLIGVIVLGMIIVNLVVFSTPTQTRIPSLEASMANRSTLITIVHQGGDSIAFGDFQILVDGVDQTGEFTNSGTFPWSVGETLSFNAPSMPQSAVMIYNGTGKGGVVILQSRFPWGVYVSGYQGGSGGEGAGGGGGFIPTTPVETYPWYDCAWGYRKNITIDHAKVSGDQANFPVLISLSSDSDLSSHAQANGNDILFTTDNGVTKISHEIESYSGGTLVAWVNVSSLSSTTDTTIMMYYGNSGAPSQQNAANVWDTGYKGVWHLNEASDTTRSDSTGNNNDLSDVNTVARSGSGMMAGAASFIQANSERLAITDATQTGLDITGDLTVEAWFRLSSTGSGPYSILEKHRGTCGSGQPPYLFRLSDGDPGYVQDVLRVTDICTGAGTDVTGTTNSISPASWYHLVGISNSTYLVLYKNGVETAAVAYSSGIFNSDGDF
ncbi:MAG: DUF2341 domain-containing protein, partial [Methanomicrobiales archaeon]|nr:DUF2341 domain-containing protein [Methanomicrobiales archaeon]